ncbi:hypothetical protein V6x_54210 [Gimesia chilikensis]|uniref:Uncharacterized protein n=1 Tax=Gimesia chilikensis TaxID=2605989 RepID=A0A517WK92_9PLAN|nr:hypothetical protein [Gimesia chilikensis]QDU05680.1 hypothetical protein V6x_54210 [Gimesia chilikensis]
MTKDTHPKLTTFFVLLLIGGILATPLVYARLYYKNAHSPLAPELLAEHIAFAQKVETLSNWCSVIGLIGIIGLLILSHINSKKK